MFQILSLKYILLLFHCFTLLHAYENIKKLVYCFFFFFYLNLNYSKPIVPQVPYVLKWQFQKYCLVYTYWSVTKINLNFNYLSVKAVVLTLATFYTWLILLFLLFHVGDHPLYVGKQ